MLNDDEASPEKEKIEKKWPKLLQTERQLKSNFAIAGRRKREKKMKMNCLPEKEKERASQLLLIASWLSFVIASSID